MRTADKVRVARNPQEALLVVAEALDSVLRELDEIAGRLSPPTATDPWGEWDPPGNGQSMAGVAEALKSAYVEPITQEYQREQEIDGVKAMIAEATDPDDIRALNARLTLLGDKGRPPEQLRPEGHRVTVRQENGQLVLDGPAVSEERKQDRYNWAAGANIGAMLTPQLDYLEAAKAYAKGGPVWLHYYDRAAVLTMPRAWRQMMVADVEQDSPAQAYELSLDILKDTDVEGEGASYEAALARAEAERA